MTRTDTRLMPTGQSMNRTTEMAARKRFQAVQDKAMETAVNHGFKVNAEKQYDCDYTPTIFMSKRVGTGRTEYIEICEGLINGLTIVEWVKETNEQEI
jgi:acetyl-CoA carboxylase beta subunit